MSALSLLTKAVLCALLALPMSRALAEQNDRVTQARDLILKLCIAGGEESVEITKKGTSIEVAGNGDSIQIERRVYSGLVGGISKEITALSAQQASEARSCTQKYLKKLVDIILEDRPGSPAQRSDQGTVGSQVSH